MITVRVPDYLSLETVNAWAKKYQHFITLLLMIGTFVYVFNTWKILKASRRQLEASCCPALTVALSSISQTSEERGQRMPPCSHLNVQNTGVGGAFEIAVKVCALKGYFVVFPRYHTHVIPFSTSLMQDGSDLRIPLPQTVVARTQTGTGDVQFKQIAAFHLILSYKSILTTRYFTHLFVRADGEISAVRRARHHPFWSYVTGLEMRWLDRRGLRRRADGPGTSPTRS